MYLQSETGVDEDGPTEQGVEVEVEEPGTCVITESSRFLILSELICIQPGFTGRR